MLRCGWRASHRGPKINIIISIKSNSELNIDPKKRYSRSLNVPYLTRVELDRVQIEVLHQWKL